MNAKLTQVGQDLHEVIFVGPKAAIMDQMLLERTGSIGAQKLSALLIFGKGTTWNQNSMFT